MRTHRVAALLAPLAVLAAAVGGAIALLAGASPVAALIAAIVAGVVAAGVPYLRCEAAVIGAAVLTPVGIGDEPRVQNLVDGLCDSNGFRRPRLAVIEDPALNAVVFGRRPERVTLALTRGLIDSLNRLELEGLLARELALANGGAVPANTVMVPLVSLLPARWRHRVTRGWLEADWLMRADFEAARLTRYPPGLAAALDRLAQAPTVVAGAGAGSAYLWVAPLTSVPAEPTIVTIEERVDALREL